MYGSGLPYILYIKWINAEGNPLLSFYQIFTAKETNFRRLIQFTPVKRAKALTIFFIKNIIEVMFF